MLINSKAIFLNRDVCRKQWGVVFYERKSLNDQHKMYVTMRRITRPIVNASLIIDGEG